MHAIMHDFLEKLEKYCDSERSICYQNILKFNKTMKQKKWIKSNVEKKHFPRII